MGLKEVEKVAIVTGGASGLGLAITKKLVQSQIKTIMIGRNENNLKDLAENLGELCSYKVYNLQNLKGIPKLIQEIVEENGKIDILVNNAGINQKKHFVEVTDEDFQNIIQTNTTAVFALSREVTRFMLEKKAAVLSISVRWQHVTVFLT